MSIRWHRPALRRALWLPLFLLLLAPLRAETKPAEAAREAESEARLKKDITYLASDECEGRGPTTKGLDRAADYIANEFKKAGLKPGGVDGTYSPRSSFQCLWESINDPESWEANPWVWVLEFKRVTG